MVEVGQFLRLTDLFEVACVVAFAEYDCTVFAELLRVVGLVVFGLSFGFILEVGNYCVLLQLLVLFAVLVRKRRLGGRLPVSAG